MRTFSVKYPTVTITRKIGDKNYVVEAIRSLDEAIDLLCDAMTDEEQKDPFAEDLCPYFGILWPSSIALAEYLNKSRELIKGKRVLELGAGLGLPSLVAAHCGADVTTTDYHPDVEFYFKRNCRHSLVDCHYERLNWRDNEKHYEPFDVVIGSDVLYESKHPKEVALGLLRYVKKDGLIILSDPGRAYLQKFLDAMKQENTREDLSFVTVDGKEIFVIKFTACIE